MERELPLDSDFPEGGSHPALRSPETDGLGRNEQLIYLTVRLAILVASDYAGS